MFSVCESSPPGEVVLSFYLPMWALLKTRAPISYVLVRKAQVEADGGNGEVGRRPPSLPLSVTHFLPHIGLICDVSLLELPEGTHLHVSGELLARKDHQSSVTQRISCCLKMMLPT